MPDYGSGLSLDRLWDLYVDESTGDLAFEDGSDEVQKDLAFNIGRALEGQIGAVTNRGQLSDIELLTTKIIEADPRIDEVTEIIVDTEDNFDTVTIDVTASMVEGETFENIFTVS